jgi:signal recognition particle GTPase
MATPQLRAHLDDEIRFIAREGDAEIRIVRVSEALELLESAITQLVEQQERTVVKLREHASVDRVAKVSGLEVADVNRIVAQRGDYEENQHGIPAPRY